MCFSVMRDSFECYFGDVGLPYRLFKVGAYCVCQLLLEVSYCVFSSACLKSSQSASFKDYRGCAGIMIGFVEGIKMARRSSLDVSSF